MIDEVTRTRSPEAEAVRSAGRTDVCSSESEPIRVHAAASSNPP
jgi:hypothetical protein